MRRVVSAAVPLILVALVTVPAAAPLPGSTAGFDLVSYRCVACEGRVVAREVNFEACQRAAYALHDGSDDMTVINPKAAQKYECRASK